MKGKGELIHIGRSLADLAGLDKLVYHAFDATPSTLGTKGPHDVQYTTIGTKTVELTITDSFGTESKVTYTVNVNDIPTGFTFTDQAKELCQGTGNSTVSVTKIDGLEYTWIADNIISGQKTNEITVDFTNATNPTVIKVFAVNSTTTKTG